MEEAERLELCKMVWQKFWIVVEDSDANERERERQKLTQQHKKSMMSKEISKLY